MHVSTQASNVAYPLSTITSTLDNTYVGSIHNEQRNIICENNNNKKENIGMSSNTSCDTEEEVSKLLINKIFRNVL